MVWIGVDVSKRSLEVCVHEGGSWTFQQPQQLQEAAEHIASLQDARVVMESTGRYERALWLALIEHEVPCSVVNPAHAHAFRRSLGKLAKSDPVDARMLARMGHSLQPQPTSLPSEQQRKLEALVLRRSQLVKMRVAERNHGEHADKATQRSIKRVRELLSKEIQRLQRDIQALLRSHGELQEQSELLQTAPGVGPTVAAALLVHLPELGHANKAQIAALAGLAPYNHDSGTMKGKRAIRAGRTPIRSMLYLAAMSASRSHPHFKALYNKLLKAGKPKKLALIAVARKLVIALNAMVRNHQAWSQSPPT